MYPKNIFIINDRRFYLQDRIEFNDTLRYADVVEDVLHLSMDHNKREDLRRHFVSQHIERSKDTSLRDLLYFLMCYKACIRAKNETDSQKRKLFQESKDFFELAFILG